MSLVMTLIVVKRLKLISTLTWASLIWFWMKVLIGIIVLIAITVFSLAHKVLGTSNTIKWALASHINFWCPIILRSDTVAHVASTLISVRIIVVVASRMTSDCVFVLESCSRCWVIYTFVVNSISLSLSLSRVAIAAHGVLNLNLLLLQVLVLSWW